MFCKQEKQHVGTTMQKNIGLTTSNTTWNYDVNIETAIFKSWIYVVNLTKCLTFLLSQYFQHISYNQIHRTLLKSCFHKIKNYTIFHWLYIVIWAKMSKSSYFSDLKTEAIFHFKITIHHIRPRMSQNSNELMFISIWIT